MAFAGLDLAVAVRAVAATPASVLGLPDRGAVVAGAWPTSCPHPRRPRWWPPSSAAGWSTTSGGARDPRTQKAPLVEVVIVDGPEAAGSLVGGAIADLVGRRPDAVLGLRARLRSPSTATRPAPRRWRTVAGAHPAFLLDEYVGLPPHHPQRYRAFIARELQQHVDLAPTAVRGPDVDVDGPALLDACHAYEQQIAAAGGIDLRAPRRRRRRPHRLQRARVVAGVAPG